MFTWTYRYPKWQMFLLFSAFAIFLSGVGTLLARPLSRMWHANTSDYNDLMLGVISASGVFYGLLLALIAMAAYENYGEVHAEIRQEVASLVALFRDTSGYPEPLRGELISALREYTRYTIEEGWALQRLGQIPTGATPRMTEYQNKLFSFRPQDAAQSILHEATLDEFTQMNKIRVLRLHSVLSGLPPVLWGVLLAGAAMNIALMWLLWLPDLGTHLFCSGVVAWFIGMMIYLISAMDHPYLGPYGATPEPFELAQRIIINSPLPPVPGDRGGLEILVPPARHRPVADVEHR